MSFGMCIVIPCYRHAGPLLAMLPRIAAFGYPVIVVDDGNPETEAEKLRSGIAALGGCCEEPQNASFSVSLARLAQNSGKGAAFIKGLLLAQSLGFSHVMQIDADGQLDIEAIPVFAKLSRNNENKIILGVPEYENPDRVRVLVRYATHFWVAVELGMWKIVDSMCGMRVYPAERAVSLVKKRKIGSRMDFDTEILVRMYWSGVDFIEQKVRVRYIKGNVSNFAAFMDNLRISLMHTKLCAEKTLHYFAVRRRQYL